MINIAQLNGVSAKLMLVILVHKLDQVSFEQAVSLAGVTSFNGYRRAVDQLAGLGVLSSVKSGRHLIVTVTHEEPLALTAQPEPTPEQPISLEQEADEIDGMPDDGKIHTSGSIAQAKRKAQIAYLQRLYAKVFPNKPAISEGSLKEWLKVGVSTVEMYDTVVAIEGRTIESPPAYIAATLRKKQQKQQSTPSNPVNGLFRTEEEARQHWTPDPLNEKLKATGRKLKPVKQDWQVDDE